MKLEERTFGTPCGCSELTAGRKKAKLWTQNQLTNRMHNYQKNTRLFGKVQNVLFHLRLTE